MLHPERFSNSLCSPLLIVLGIAHDFRARNLIKVVKLRSPHCRLTLERTSGEIGEREKWLILMLNY